jgi:hypothetical protein
VAKATQLTGVQKRVLSGMQSLALERAKGNVIGKRQILRVP